MRPEHVEYIVIHASATTPTMDIGVKKIDRWHRQKGYFMVGYHKVIRRDGTEEDGRPLDRFGAHAYGYNQRSIGICMAGGVKRVTDRDGKDDADGPRWDLVPENNFTEAQFVALEMLIRSLKDMGYGHAEIVGHRDLPRVTKPCPCFDVRDWLRLKGFIE
jgi:N-acetylmuramoyl-L-alanine amidase